MSTVTKTETATAAVETLINELSTLSAVEAVLAIEHTEKLITEECENSFEHTESISEFVETMENEYCSLAALIENECCAENSEEYAEYCSAELALMYKNGVLYYSEDCVYFEEYSKIVEELSEEFEFCSKNSKKTSGRVMNNLALELRALNEVIEFSENWEEVLGAAAKFSTEKVSETEVVFSTEHTLICADSKNVYTVKVK